MLLALVIAALSMWIGATKYVDPTVTAVVAVVLMVLLRVVSWNDVIGHTQAWNVLVWFATLVTLASGLAETKFMDWIAQTIAPAFAGLGVIPAVTLLVAAFFFVHYLFASITAHTAALLPVFLGIAVQFPGVSRKAVALLLAYTLGLMSILTPYAAGQSPIYFGSGYIKARDLWVFGLILGLAFFVVYLAIVVPWLAFLQI